MWTRTTKSYDTKNIILGFFLKHVQVKAIPNKYRLRNVKCSVFTQIRLCRLLCSVSSLSVFHPRTVSKIIWYPFFLFSLYKASMKTYNSWEESWKNQKKVGIKNVGLFNFFVLTVYSVVFLICSFSSFLTWCFYSMLIISSFFFQGLVKMPSSLLTWWSTKMVFISVQTCPTLRLHWSLSLIKASKLHRMCLN